MGTRSLEDAENKIKYVNNTKESPDSDNCKDHREKILEMARANKIVTNALSKAENRIKDLEEQIGDSTEKIMNSYNKVDSESKEVKSLEDALDKAEGKVRELEFKLKHSDKSGESPIVLQLALEEKDKIISSQENVIKTLEKNVLESAEQFEETLKLSEQRDENLKKEFDESIDTMNNLKKVLKEKQDHVAVLDNELHSAKVNINELEEKCYKLDKIANIFEANPVSSKLNLLENELKSLSSIFHSVQQLSKYKTENEEGG